MTDYTYEQVEELAHIIEKDIRWMPDFSDRYETILENLLEFLEMRKRSR